MKFSEIEQDRWEELAPYVDTVLLPLSGLKGTELPWEATEALERLRDALDPLESSFKGRVLTYPAVHYAVDDASLEELADALCERLAASGFAHCIVVIGSERLRKLRFARASAVIGPCIAEEGAEPEPYARRAKRAVEAVWYGQARSQL